MPLSNPSLGCVPKSIPHTLPGLATDDLIDSTQSSDLQTNRLFQLEKGVTATKPELSADDKSFLQATDVILNNGGWLLLERYLPPVLHSYRLLHKMGKERSKTSNGSLLPFTNWEVLKINFHDNGYASWLARASEHSARVRRSVFLGVFLTLLLHHSLILPWSDGMTDRAINTSSIRVQFSGSHSQWTAPCAQALQKQRFHCNIQ